MKKPENIINLRFNYLTVINFYGNKINKLGQKSGRLWECLCDCGNKVISDVQQLKSGKKKSCGCKNFLDRNSLFSPQAASYRAKASNYKAGAKNRNLSFSLSIDETVALLKADCSYCGTSPTRKYNLITRNRKYSKRGIVKVLQKTEHYDILYNGIDRINNTLGYHKNNVVTCCTRCNSAKSDSSHEEFMKWLNNLVKFRSNL